jgi:hypothetical protein
MNEEIAKLRERDRLIKVRCREVNDWLSAGRLVYWTNPDGVQRPVFRMRILKGELRVLPIGGRHWCRANHDDKYTSHRKPTKAEKAAQQQQS